MHLFDGEFFSKEEGNTSVPNLDEICSTFGNSAGFIFAPEFLFCGFMVLKCWRILLCFMAFGFIIDFTLGLGICCFGSIIELILVVGIYLSVGSTKEFTLMPGICLGVGSTREFTLVPGSDAFATT